MSKHHPYDDDIDDIMASIMQGSAEQAEPPSKPKKRPSKPIKQPSYINAGNSSHLNNTKTEPAQGIKYKSKSKFPVRASLSLLAISVIIGGGVLLWNGPISALLTPPSPFEPELVERMGTSLYYPTKLPGTFKIETNSITQPEDSVVVYVITDDEGHKINVSMQKQPKGLNLEPLYKALDNVRDIETKFGTLKYGASEEGMDMLNVLTDETWVIITTKQGLLEASDIQTIVNSLHAVR